MTNEIFEAIIKEYEISAMTSSNKIKMFRFLVGL